MKTTMNKKLKVIALTILATLAPSSGMMAQDNLETSVGAGFGQWLYLAWSAFRRR